VFRRRNQFTAITLASDFRRGGHSPQLPANVSGGRSLQVNRNDADVATLIVECAEMARAGGVIALIGHLFQGLVGPEQLLPHTAGGTGRKVNNSHHHGLLVNDDF